MSKEDEAHGSTPVGRTGEPVLDQAAGNRNAEGQFWVSRFELLLREPAGIFQLAVVKATSVLAAALKPSISEEGNGQGCELW